VNQPAAAVPSTWSEIGYAVRRNLVPGLCLWSFAAALVACYYLLPATRGWWDAIGSFKDGTGLWIAFIATVVTTCFLPMAIIALMGLCRRDRLGWRLFAGVLFWGWRGIEVDLLYRGQAWLFGDGHDAATIACKVAFDQFIYCPLWAVPNVALGLRFLDRGASWSAFRDGLDWRTARHLWWSTMLATWMVWIPATSLIYSLPVPLQFPLFSLVSCFGVLVVTLLVAKR
jgi:hypothetical protein